MHHIPRYLCAPLFVALTALQPAALAQAYPAKPVRILVGFAPGGGTDIMARAIGAKLGESMKQQFIVDNRPGANANLAAKLAAEAPGDGYTLLFMSVAHIMTKTNLLPIPYKGGGPIAIDLVGGHVISSFSTMPPIIPHIRSNRVRAIAVTTGKRASVLPDVPTIGETVPGYVMSTWYGAVAPVKTPHEIVQRLNREMIKALALPDVKERMASLGTEVVGTSPEGTATIFKTDIAKFTKVAHQANIHAD